MNILPVQETKMSDDVRIGKISSLSQANLKCVSPTLLGRPRDVFFFLLTVVQPIPMMKVVTDEAGLLTFSDVLLYSEEYRVICAYAPNYVSESNTFFVNCYRYQKRNEMSFQQAMLFASARQAIDRTHWCISTEVKISLKIWSMIIVNSTQKI